MNYNFGFVGIACAGCLSLSSCFFPFGPTDDDSGSAQNNGNDLGIFTDSGIPDYTIDDVQSREDRWISDCDIQNNETTEVYFFGTFDYGEIIYSIQNYNNEKCFDNAGRFDVQYQYVRKGTITTDTGLSADVYLLGNAMNILTYMISFVDADGNLYLNIQQNAIPTALDWSVVYRRKID